MAKADYYDQLGVDRSASAAELKSAYRKLAKKFHPDVNPGDAAAEQKFKDISEAYEVLKDDQSRAAYDQLGHAAFEQGGGFGGQGGFGGAGGFSGFGDIGDIFEEFAVKFTVAYGLTGLTVAIALEAKASRVSDDGL